MLELWEILKCYPKSTILMFYQHQTKDNISSTQHKLQYNNGVVKQDSAAQQ